MAVFKAKDLKEIRERNCGSLVTWYPISPENDLLDWMIVRRTLDQDRKWRFQAHEHMQYLSKMYRMKLFYQWLLSLQRIQIQSRRPEVQRLGRGCQPTSGIYGRCQTIVTLESNVLPRLCGWRWGDTYICRLVQYHSHLLSHSRCLGKSPASAMTVSLS